MRIGDTRSYRVIRPASATWLQALLCMILYLGLLSLPPSNAAVSTTLDEARTAGIRWLERNQDRWLGSGDVLTPGLGERTTEGVGAAEALLALAESERSAEYGAQRAAAWLRGQEVEATDFRARRIRALVAAGLDVAGERLRLCEERGSQGWGVLPGGSPSAYDTARGSAAVDKSDGLLTPGASVAPARSSRRATRWAQRRPPSIASVRGAR